MMKADVSTNGKTVWVDSNATGMCLARFCPFSGEVFSGTPDTALYLFHVQGPTGCTEWDKWVEAVKAHHGVKVSDKMRPLYAK